MAYAENKVARIRPQQFHEAAGVEDWRVVGEGACAYFRSGSFAVGARFVQAIGEMPGIEAGHVDVDVRQEGVTVRLITITDDSYGLTGHHVDTVRRISAVARTLGMPADPSGVQTVQVTIDALARPEVVAFWRALLGYEARAHSGEDLVDPRRRGAPFHFQRMDAPRPQRSRVHVDAWVPYDQAEARIAAALAAGGRLVNDADASSNRVPADPEGNEACVGVAGPPGPATGPA
ncbi:VOC family protein [Streptomyces sp. KHY 26]|uniref:VOC family protein n=1 Tax=Streptomyces sp. KHY 26 TaxID=3097359 RepID=UPI00376EA8EC